MGSRTILFKLLLSILLLGACQGERKKESFTPAKAIDSVFLAYETLRTDKDADVEEKLRLNKELLTRYGNTGDSLEFALLKHRAGMHRSLGQLDSTLMDTRKLLDRATAVRDTANMADAYFRLGYYNRLLDQYDASLEGYYRAVELYKALGDSINTGKKLLNLANLLNQQVNLHEAEELAVEGLKYLEASPEGANQKYVSGLYNALAISTMKAQNYGEALSWYNKALMASRDSIINFRIRTNIATVYLHQQKYAKARNLLREMADDPFWDSGEYPKDLARVLDNLGWAKSKLGEPDAERPLQEGLKLRQAAEFKRGILESYLHLAEHYSRNNVGRAREMAIRAYDLAQQLGLQDDTLSALSLLIEFAERPRAYALEYKRISDSLTGARVRSRDNFAKIRFESERNRQNYLIAQEQAAQRALELERADRRNLLLLGLLALLVTGAYLGYRYLQWTNRLKRLKASFEAENRISKKVHDELANDLFNIMNYASQKPLASEGDREFLIDQLDRAYARSRNIARESAAVSVGKDFRQELKGLADGYHSEGTRILLKGLDTFPWERLQDLGKATCYRVLQELLVNMKKHSGATLVLLEFSRPGRWLLVRYKDNGVGLRAENTVRRNGLANAENRIRALGGSFTVSPEQDSGMECTFTLPLN